MATGGLEQARCAFALSRVLSPGLSVAPRAERRRTPLHRSAADAGMPAGQGETLTSDPVVTPRLGPVAFQSRTSHVPTAHLQNPPPGAFQRLLPSLLTPTREAAPRDLTVQTRTGSFNPRSSFTHPHPNPCGAPRCFGRIAAGRVPTPPAAGAGIWELRP